MFLKDIGSGPVLEESGGSDPMPYTAAIAETYMSNVEPPITPIIGGHSFNQQPGDFEEENLDGTQLEVNSTASLI